MIPQQAGPQEDESARVSAAMRGGIWLCVALIAAVLGWAMIGRLDVVSTAIGEVVPSSQVKLVQHLEGGVVAEILVKEGESVAAGQPLVTLQTIAPDADVEQMTLRIRALTIDVARLEAEAADSNKLVFSADVESLEPTAAREAQKTFRTRRERIAEQMEVQRQTISQRRNEVGEIDARLQNNNKRLALVQEQIAISDSLMVDGLTNQMEHLNLLQGRSALEGKIAEDKASRRRAVAAMKGAERSLSGIKTGYLQDVREKLDESRRALAETEQRLRKVADTLGRAVLRASDPGVIKRLHVSTVGGVVQAGQTVAEIVPGEDKLIIEARLPPQEIGFVNVGQSAMLQLASADAARFGAIDGVVDFISPDTIIENEEEGAFYQVRITTDASAFIRGQASYRLVPGVQIMCAIRTGDRTVMDYVLDPFLASVRTAMRER